MGAMASAVTLFLTNMARSGSNDAPVHPTNQVEWAPRLATTESGALIGATDGCRWLAFDAADVRCN
jgi:hypothetical protein